MKTLQKNQLTTSNKLLLMKAISNYDFYYDFSELMQDTDEKDETVDMTWYFDVKTNEIRLETNKENTWSEYEHGYDNSYHIYGLEFSKGYEQNLYFAFNNVISNFDMLVSQGKFGRMVRTADKDLVNLNTISWIINKIIK